MDKETFSRPEFFNKYGTRVCAILHAPEQKYEAQQFLDKGYSVASVFEEMDPEDPTNFLENVTLDNDTGEGFHKTAFIVLEPMPINVS